MSTEFLTLTIRLLNVSELIELKPAVRLPTIRKINTLYCWADSDGDLLGALDKKIT